MSQEQIDKLKISHAKAALVHGTTSYETVKVPIIDREFMKKFVSDKTAQVTEENSDQSPEYISR